ncbi:MAG: SGNH/GDSL hydrolase family protein [Anaerolineae bacterium]|nr:SGNH/GDSL hydrolase family protein [Anaerolineae bacterium]
MTTDAQPHNANPSRFSVHPLRILLASSGISLIILALAADLLPDSAAGLGVYQVSALIIGAGILLVSLLIRKLPVLIAAVIGIGAAASPPVVDHFYDPPRSLWAQEDEALRHMAPDPRLGQVIPPNTGGHDALGFRNDSVPDHADMVTLGDSQTWSANAPRDKAWPSVLAELTGQTVYNMGMPGYGPVHYWVLTGDALAQFDPDTILVGFYFGNDFYGAYNMAYTFEPYYEFRDETLVNSLTQARESIADQSERTYTNMERLRYTGDTNSTILLPQYRLIGVNLDDPRIAEGLRISQVMLGQIADLVNAADKRLIVVLVPTKELAYAPLIAPPLDPMYQQLVDMENETRAALMGFMDERGIEYVDSLLPLQDHLVQGEAMYLTTPDGHPAPAGYRVIAAMVADYLQTDPVAD